MLCKSKHHLFGPRFCLQEKEIIHELFFCETFCRAQNLIQLCICSETPYSYIFRKFLFNPEIHILEYAWISCQFLMPINHQEHSCCLRWILCIALREVETIYQGKYGPSQIPFQIEVIWRDLQFRLILGNFRGTFKKVVLGVGYFQKAETIL